jgi:hypothetical protein
MGKGRPSTKNKAGDQRIKPNQNSTSNTGNNKRCALPIPNINQNDRKKRSNTPPPVPNINQNDRKKHNTRSNTQSTDQNVLESPPVVKKRRHTETTNNLINESPGKMVNKIFFL